MGMEGIDLRTGTSGYDYPEWSTVLYPSFAQRKDYLEIYSNTFNTLELNFSYYGMPKANNIAAMLQRANASLDFSIKAHKSLTHEVDTTVWRDTIKEYLKGIEPLAASNRLAAILLEFPARFHYLPDNRIYLDKLLAELNGFPIVVELRNTEWFNDRVYEGLKKRNASLCFMDLPHEYSPQLPQDESFNITYIRFHGRNKDNWYDGTNVSRYDYLYNDNELKEWVLRIKQNKGKTKKVRIYFNNHAKGNAVKNAQRLQEMLEEE